MRTEQQKHHFDTLGFLALPGPLPRAAVDITKREPGEIYKEWSRGSSNLASNHCPTEPAALPKRNPSPVK